MLELWRGRTDGSCGWNSHPYSPVMLHLDLACHVLLSCSRTAYLPLCAAFKSLYLTLLRAKIIQFCFSMTFASVPRVSFYVIFSVSTMWMGDMSWTPSSGLAWALVLLSNQCLESTKLSVSLLIPTSVRSRSYRLAVLYQLWPHILSIKSPSLLCLCENVTIVVLGGPHGPPTKMLMRAKPVESKFWIILWQRWYLTMGLLPSSLQEFRICIRARPWPENKDRWDPNQWPYLVPSVSWPFMLAPTKNTPSLMGWGKHREERSGLQMLSHLFSHASSLKNIMSRPIIKATSTIA